MYQISIKDYEKNLKKRFPNDDFTVLSFTAAIKPVTIKCNKCNKIYNYNRGTTLYSNRRKNICTFCSSKIVQGVYKSCEINNITIINHSYNTIDPWYFRCNICGEEFSRIIYHWKTKQCPKCLAEKRSTVVQFNWQKIIDDLCGESEFEVLKNTSADHFFIKHKCGFIRKTQSGAFLRSPWCPRCKGTMSKGERKILDYLQKNNISYEAQKKIPDSHQTFDFYIQPNIAIEFNGKQHYEPIEVFGGEQRFEQQLIYDKNKEEYCKNNKIFLLVISYKEYENIDTILDSFFRKFNDQSKDVREN